MTPKTKLTRREADALIAEKVMGWHKCWSGGLMGRNPNHFQWKDAAGITHSPFGENPTEFTTDPAASKQLREKLAAQGWDNQSLMRLQSGRFGFQMLKPDGTDCGGEASPTEELAVALCALKSVGIDAEIAD